MTLLDDRAPPGRGVPRRVRMTYAALSLPTNAISQAWGLWLIYFYAPPGDASIGPRAEGVFGLDARVLLGAVLTLGRVLEALDDPLVGYWSDRTRSRWGRRIPFVLLGTPLWGVLFVLLFLPPSEGASHLNLGFLFVVAVSFYLFSNLSGAPLEALLPTMARRNQDRLSIASWQVVFGVLGAVVGLSVSALLQGLFGFTVMAVTIATVAVAVRYLALFGCWQYALADDQPARPGFRRSVGEIFRNPQFRAYLPSFVFFQVALQMLIAALPFFVDTVFREASLLGWTAREDTGQFTFILTAGVIGGMLVAVPFFRRWAARAGKARVFRAAMLGAAAYFPALALAGLVPGLPVGVQAVGAVFLAGLPTAGVFLFPGIITADIVDEDARRSGDRREAMYYGAQNTLEKMATALAPLLFAVVLLAGDTADDPLGVRLVGPVAGLMALLAFLSFRRYSLPDQPEQPDQAGPPSGGEDQGAAQGEGDAR